MASRLKIKEQIERPRVAVDAVVFAVLNKKLNLLLIKRAAAPFKDMWALPGGHVDKNEPLEKAVERELKEETGIKNIYLEQLYTFGEPHRDPRGRVISIAHFALIGRIHKVKSATDAAEAKWFSVKKLPSLAFDHKKIIQYALKRLQWKLEYTNIVRSLLPALFTLSELQQIYEIILGKRIDKRNFRKKILAMDLIESVRRKKSNVPYRPPHLWRFITTKHVVLEKRELVF